MVPKLVRTSKTELKNFVVEVRPHNTNELDLYIECNDDLPGMLSRVDTWLVNDANKAMSLFYENRKEFWRKYADHCTTSFYEGCGAIFK